MNYEKTEIKITVATDIPYEEIIESYGLDYDAGKGDIETAVIKYLKSQGYQKPTLPKETIDKLYVRHNFYWAFRRIGL